MGNSKSSDATPHNLQHKTNIFADEFLKVFIYFH